jgi:hypothetical protein
MRKVPFEGARSACVKDRGPIGNQIGLLRADVIDPANIIAEAPPSLPYVSVNYQRARNSLTEFDRPMSELELLRGDPHH